LVFFAVNPNGDMYTARESFSDNIISSW
jgi:hypothetical protein